MKIVNLCPEFLSPGWMVAKLPEHIPPRISGLASTFLVKLSFKLRHREPPLPLPDRAKAPHGDKFIADDPSQGLAYASDFVPFKPRADFVVAGTAYPPQAHCHAFQASATVGPLSKAITITGQRFWTDTVVGPKQSTPAALSPIALSYANAWGGTDYSYNPIGCGRLTPHLPQIEQSGMKAINRNSTVMPAGFSPLGWNWGQRAGKFGTFDDEWTATTWPWLPRDFDFSFFNAAPSNQWFEGYLRGDEPMSFRNLHKSLPVFESRLPGWRPRCFLTQTINWQPSIKPSDAVLTFSEVPLQLDTLWVNLDEETGILVWRGRAPVRSVKLLDVDSLVVDLERDPNHSKKAREYEQARDDFLQPKPKESDIARLPDLNHSKELIQIAVAKGQKRSAELQVEARRRAHDDLARVRKEKEIVLREAAELREQNPEAAQIREKPTSFRGPEVKATIPEDRMTPELKAELASKKALVDSFPDEPPFPDDSAKLKANHDRAKALIEEKKKQHQNIIAMFPVERRKEDFFRNGHLDLAKLRREGGANVDFTQCNFGDLNLTGVDLRGSILMKCSFRNATLFGANLTGCNLSKADLSGADFTSAVLMDCDLSDSDATGTRWTKAFLTRSVLRKLDLSGADFTGCHGEHADFSECRLAGAAFTGASLLGALFTSARLEKSNFLRASLVYADFRGAKAAESNFDDADALCLRAGDGADFERCSFRRLAARTSVWDKSNLTGANFLQAVLPNTRFAEANLSNAYFDRCNLTASTFEDAIMIETTLSNANLFRCNFERANLTKACMDGSNLFDSGFWEANLQGAMWRGANVKRTRLEARL